MSKLPQRVTLVFADFKSDPTAYLDPSLIAGDWDGISYLSAQYMPAPMPTPRIRTHWDDCWREHHECAVVRAERLAGQVALAITALEATPCAYHCADVDSDGLPVTLTKCVRCSALIALRARS